MRPQNFHSGHVLGIAALLSPIMGVFAPNLITPLTVLALLGLLILRAVRRDTAIRSDRPLLLIVGLLSLWTLISVIWTPYEDGAFIKYLSVIALAALAVGALVLTPALAEHERHALRRYALAGIVVALLLFFFEMLTNGAISQDLLRKVPVHGSTLDMFNQTSSVLFLFVCPLTE